MKEWRNKLYAHNDLDTKLKRGTGLPALRPSDVQLCIDAIIKPLDFLNQSVAGAVRANKLISQGPTELEVLYLLERGLNNRGMSGYPDWLTEDNRNKFCDVNKTMKNDTDILIIVDLEATCCDQDTIPREDMEIIEIGACAVDLSDFSVVDDFQLYIRPVVHRELTAFCTKLTGIEQTTVDAADEFSLAIGSYRDWLSGFGAIKAWSSWGNYDKNQFLQDYARHATPDLHEDLKHLNLKNLFAKAEGERMGLGWAIEKMGVKFEGRAHCGRDDALNMARLLTLSTKFGDVIRNRVYG